MQKTLFSIGDLKFFVLPCDRKKIEKEVIILQSSKPTDDTTKELELKSNILQREDYIPEDQESEINLGNGGKLLINGKIEVETFFDNLYLEEKGRFSISLLSENGRQFFRAKKGLKGTLTNFRDFGNCTFKLLKIYNYENAKTILKNGTTKKRLETA